MVTLVEYKVPVRPESRPVGASSHYWGEPVLYTLLRKYGTNSTSKICQYRDLYLTLDVLLLAHVFDNI